MILSNKQVVVDAVDLGLCVSFVAPWEDGTELPWGHEIGRMRKGDPGAVEPDLIACRILGEDGRMVVTAFTADGEAFLSLVAA